MLSKIKLIFKPKHQIYWYSIKGRKNIQEDSYYISEEKNKQQLLFVADGVGGHGHGDFASQLCVEIFKTNFLRLGKIIEINNFLEDTAYEVAKQVLKKGEEYPEFKNCGTTISGIFVDNKSYYTINIGDSRVYSIADNKLNRETKDHSKVQRLIDTGIITETEARVHPEKNMMTSAIGQSLNMITIDINGPKELYKNKLLFACTDGIHDALDDAEIETFFNSNEIDNNLAEKLVTKAYKSGINDNITLCILVI